MEVDDSEIRAIMLSLMSAHEKLDDLLELVFGDDEEEADNHS